MIEDYTLETNAFGAEEALIISATVQIATVANFSAFLLLTPLIAAVGSNRHVAFGDLLGANHRAVSPYKFLTRCISSFTNSTSFLYRITFLLLHSSSGKDMPL